MSTVLDVAFCLLLVGVAVSTLALAVPDESEEMTVDSDATAHSLATVTASVPADNEQVHGTLAEHLAHATVTNATYDGERIIRSTYPDAVEGEIEAQTGVRSHITARWEPYPDAPIGSRVSVGTAPPPTVDVAATKLTVDSGMTAFETEASFESIAASIAKAYVERLFPPERTRVKLVDARTAKPTAGRYEEAEAAFDADLGGAIADADTERANGRLVAALADRLESDLRLQYAAAENAAAETATGEIKIVVRRWEQ